MLDPAQDVCEAIGLSDATDEDLEEKLDDNKVEGFPNK